MCDESSWKVAPGILVTYDVNALPYHRFSITLNVSALLQVKKMKLQYVQWMLLIVSTVF